MTTTQTHEPRTLAEELGYSPESFRDYNEKRSEALLEVEKREQERINKALQTKMAWQA